MQELMTKMKRKRRTWPEAGGNEIWAGVYSKSEDWKYINKFYHISRLDEETHNCLYRC